LKTPGLEALLRRAEAPSEDAVSGGAVDVAKVPERRVALDGLDQTLGDRLAADPQEARQIADALTLGKPGDEHSSVVFALHERDVFHVL